MRNTCSFFDLHVGFLWNNSTKTCGFRGKKKSGSGSLNRPSDVWGVRELGDLRTQGHRLDKPAEDFEGGCRFPISEKPDDEKNGDPLDIFYHFFMK